MPESLLAALEDLGQQVDSVNHLKLKGLDNGTLYRQVARDYDLCFTRDAGFAHNVRQLRDQLQVKVLHVVVPQQRTESFVPAFIDAFQNPTGLAIRTATTGHNFLKARHRVQYVESGSHNGISAKRMRPVRASGEVVGASGG